jgi:peptidoglycan hydrolase CwlO-like protein
MIIVFVSIAAAAAVPSTWALMLASKNGKLTNSLNDKCAVIEALQEHADSVESNLTNAKAEIKTLKSTIQSLNDKAKAKKGSTPKVEKEVATMSTSMKRAYKKKSKVTA